MDGGVALKSVLFGLYVCNPKIYMLSCSDEVKCVPSWDDYYKDGLNPAGLFKMEYNGSGGWPFLAPNGKYLCVDDGDQIKASRYNKGPWETFRLELLNEPDLQDQINAVNPGGTVYLKEGVYRRQNVVIDKSVNIIGAGSGRTVVDGDYKGSVFTIGKNDAGIDVTLAGITIQGGQNIIGGAIYNSGRLTVKDSTITKNAADRGGGVYGYGGILTLNNCQIT